jgi:N-acetyltransferase 10
VSSHRAKRARQVQRLAARGLLNPDDEDPFSLFVAR